METAGKLVDNDELRDALKENGIGRPGPCTPWGKPALGLKTRKKNKQSNKLIVRRRNGKAIS